MPVRMSPEQLWLGLPQHYRKGATPPVDPRLPAHYAGGAARPVRPEVEFVSGAGAEAGVGAGAGAGAAPGVRQVAGGAVPRMAREGRQGALHILRLLFPNMGLRETVAHIMRLEGGPELMAALQNPATQQQAAARLVQFRAQILAGQKVSLTGEALAGKAAKIARKEAKRTVGKAELGAAGKTLRRGGVKAAPKALKGALKGAGKVAPGGLGGALLAALLLGPEITGLMGFGTGVTGTYREARRTERAPVPSAEEILESMRAQELLAARAGMLEQNNPDMYEALARMLSGVGPPAHGMGVPGAFMWGTGEPAGMPVGNREVGALLGQLGV